MKTTIGIKAGIIAVLLGLGANAYAEAGTAGGGGGTTVQLSSGQDVLLDLVNLGTTRTPGVKLESRSLPTLKFDYICLGCGSTHGLLAPSAPLIKLVTKKLNAFAKYDAETAKIIAAALKIPMVVANFLVTPGSIEADLTGMKFELVDKLNIGAAFKKDHVIAINSQEFNRLGLEDQAGLLIHEALRAVQIQNSRSFSNRELQQMVLAIISESPDRIQETTSAFMKVKSGPEENDVTVAVAKACEADQKLPSQMSEVMPKITEVCQNLTSDSLQKSYLDVLNNEPSVLSQAQTDSDIQNFAIVKNQLRLAYYGNLVAELQKNDISYFAISNMASNIPVFISFDIYNGRK